MMADVEIGETSYSPILMMVQQIVFNDNLLIKLKATDVIINALDDETKKKVGALEFQRYIHRLFSEKEFIRRLTYLATIKSNIELSVEYHGQDYISAPEHHYDIQFETKTLIVEKKLAEFLGKIIKNSNKGTQLTL
jgi:hypothetical protein